MLKWSVIKYLVSSLLMVGAVAPYGNWVRFLPIVRRDSLPLFQKVILWSIPFWLCVTQFKFCPFSFCVSRYQRPPKKFLHINHQHCIGRFLSTNISSLMWNTWGTFWTGLAGPCWILTKGLGDNNLINLILSQHHEITHREPVSPFIIHSYATEGSTWALLQVLVYQNVLSIFKSGVLSNCCQLLFFLE